jgi:hypothetical protein
VTKKTAGTVAFYAVPVLTLGALGVLVAMRVPEASVLMLCLASGLALLGVAAGQILIRLGSGARGRWFYWLIVVGVAAAVFAKGLSTDGQLLLFALDVGFLISVLAPLFVQAFRSQQSP